MITDNIPPYSEDQRVDGIAEGCRAYNATGLTGVAEPGLYPYEIAAYTRARREGKLTVRTDMLIAAWGFGVRKAKVTWSRTSPLSELAAALEMTCCGWRASSS